MPLAPAPSRLSHVLLWGQKALSVIIQVWCVLKKSETLTLIALKISTDTHAMMS